MRAFVIRTTRTDEKSSDLTLFFHRLAYTRRQFARCCCRRAAIMHRRPRLAVLQNLDCDNKGDRRAHMEEISALAATWFRRQTRDCPSGEKRSKHGKLRKKVEKLPARSRATRVNVPDEQQSAQATVVTCGVRGKTTTATCNKEAHDDLGTARRTALHVSLDGQVSEEE